jgi:hypothetical protein
MALSSVLQLQQAFLSAPFAPLVARAGRMRLSVRAAF